MCLCVCVQGGSWLLGLVSVGKICYQVLAIHSSRHKSLLQNRISL